MTQRRYLLSTVALASVLAAAAAMAQEAPPQAPQARMRIHEPGTGLRQGRMPMRREIGPMGPGWSGPGPQGLLQHREFLELTDEQVTRLEALSESFVEEHTALRQSLQAQREELRALLEQEQPDPTAIRTATKARLDLEQELVLGQLDAATAARGVLTADQQSKWRGFREGMRQGARSSRAMRGPRNGRVGRTGREGARGDMRRMPRMRRN